jgi:mannosyltransferase OCH1-like enzyme
MDIVKHDDTQRMEQREQGRAYAESCSWANRAQQWVKVLDSGGQRVAIVNSLPYHYEMFGYILNYFAKMHNARTNQALVLSIFTETIGNNWGWFDFYKEHFSNTGLEFEYKALAEFDELKTRKQFDVIFIPTDDDMGINPKWIDERFIAIEHTPQMRRPEYHHRIAVRPFAFGLHGRWTLPCYDIVGVSKKMDCILHQGEELHVALIGGYSNIDVGFINRLTSSNGSMVKLHCIGSCWRPNHIMFDLSLLNKNIELIAHGVLYTYSLIEELKTCDYVITDVINEDHIAGKSMSGAIPLAFSTLTPLIIGKQNNSIYKFKTAVEVDMNSAVPIVLKKISNEMVHAVALERAELVRMAEVEFDRCIQCIQCIQCMQHEQPSLIPKRVMQTWEHKRLGAEFQAIVDTWKTHNPHYEFVMMDAEDREQFIRAHFQHSVIDAYARIIPGAYKSDLFRYCYLWVNGGVYADIDTLCLGSLDDFLVPGAGLVVPIDLNLSANEGTHNLACGFIAVIPKHPAMMRCIQIAVRNVQNATVPRSKLDFTGPGVLGRAVNEYLCNDETESFVGKEGLHPQVGIHFLKFEPGTELVKDMKHQVLFQNKNGNHEIANLYHAECCKLKDFVSWVQCASPFETLKQSQLTQNKNIALMIYGQFRTYANNLRENIRILAPLFGFGKMQSCPCKVHVFILSNKLASGNYSEQNENEIRGIFDEFGFTICFFDYVENLDSIHDENERAAHDSYFTNLKNHNGVNNEFIPDIMYRKFALNQIKNAYCNQHRVNMDLHVFGRLFDVIVRHPPTTTLTQPCIQKQIQYEIDKLTICSSDKLTIMGSSDTLFIGTQEPMDHLFECAMHLRGPEIWNDPDFLDVMMRADSYLCASRATYSPEVQYIARVHVSNFKYRNIRFDFNNPESPANHSSFYDIRLDPNRCMH